MTQNADKSTEDKRARFWGSLGHLPLIWWFVTLGMIFLWFLTPTIVQDLHNKTEEKGSGAFGDTFGYITSLFSIVTTMLVVAGLIFQRREIDQLEQALKQQAEEAEIQNGLTRQQMAYHEIQTRIDSLPNLTARIENRAEPIGQVYLVITNSGADVYALEVRVRGKQVTRACLAKGDDWRIWVCLAKDMGPYSTVVAELEYVTRYAEKRNEEIDAGKEEGGVGSFYEAAKTIRAEVFKRSAVSQPEAVED